MMTRLRIFLFSLLALMAAGTAEAAAPTITRAVALNSDPINLVVFPKAIQGAIVTYTVTVKNPNVVTTFGSFVLTDSINTIAVPQGAEYYVGTGTNNPFVYTDGVLGLGGSGLAYTFTSLSSTTDSVAFSCDSGATWTCTPQPDADGYDYHVTNIRITFTNSFAAGGAFTFALKARVR